MRRPAPKPGGYRIGGSGLLLGLALIAVAATALGPVALAQSGSGDAAAALQEHSVDGLRLALEVDRQELAIDGRIRMSIQLEVPPDRIAGLPDLGDQFGPFAVVVQSPAESSSAGGMIVLRRYYDLEPEGVGELAVKPFRPGGGVRAPAGPGVGAP